MNKKSRICLITALIAAVVSFALFWIGNMKDPVFLLVFAYMVIVAVSFFIAGIAYLIKDHSKKRFSIWGVLSLCSFILAVVSGIYVVYDINFNKTMFFAGLGGTLVMLFILPVFIFLTILFLGIKIVKKRINRKNEQSDSSI